MAPRVHVELRAQTEGAAAGAGVRARAGVRGGVRAQLARAAEPRAARAREARARVRAPVRAQRRGRRGFGPARLAQKRSSSEVLAHVRSEVLQAGERAVASRTLVRTSERVDRARVPRQVSRVRECATARRAAEPLPFSSGRGDFASRLRSRRRSPGLRWGYVGIAPGKETRVRSARGGADGADSAGCARRTWSRSARRSL